MMPMHKNALDLTGRRFGRLTAIETAASRYGQRVWRCLCDCGTYTEALAGNIRRGKTTSCGCYAKEVASRVKSTHGMAGTPIHKIWKGMKNRCLNSSDPAFKDYGARGIEVCERWLTFENFFVDMGNCPAGKSLDRIDNSKGYFPENCRWATDREQSLNRRSSKFLELNGVRKNISEWACHLGIGDSTIRQRLFQGWTVERALLTPVRRKR